jgi:hypothetical protein
MKITCIKKADGLSGHPLFHGDLPRNMPVREKSGWAHSVGTCTLVLPLSHPLFSLAA